MKKQFIKLKHVKVCHVDASVDHSFSCNIWMISFDAIKFLYKLGGNYHILTDMYIIAVSESDFNFICSLFDIIVCDSERKDSAL